MNQAPVKEGEEHIVRINAVGEKGDGIAKVGGFVLFIPDTKKGDYVKIKVTKVLEKVGFGKFIEKVEKPVKKSKFATVTEEELNDMEEISDDYEETEDFGEDLEDDE